MKDDFVSLFTFNRWANARMLEACRKLTPEQYAAEPVPGWSSVRATVWHIAVTTEGWLRGLANDPDETFPTEAELATVDDAQRLLERAYRRFDALLAALTPERLATPVTYRRRGRSATLPPVGRSPPRRQSHDLPPRAGGLQAQALRRPAGGHRLGVLGLRADPASDVRADHLPTPKPSATRLM
jgi:hypothetical protein